jgi:membrane-bound lytic murein transglycosylase A
MYFNEGNMKFKLYALCSVLCALLSACDLSTGPTQTNDNSIIPSNLKKADYSDLPGWRDDDVRYALQAFRNSCKAKIQYSGRVVPDRELMAEKCKLMPGAGADTATVRKWFEAHFQPYKVNDESGTASGKFTGYYSPVVNACRTQTAKCSVPIMDTPLTQNYKGIDSKTLVKNRIGRVIFWIDPVDLQDMGSATLILEDGEKVKVNVASTNDLPFNGIGSQLQKRGIRPPNGGYTMKAVRSFLKQPENKKLALELVDNNPRYVYYRAAEKFDVIGKLGVGLSKIRSIALDDSIYTLGTPVYVDTNVSVNGQKFRRLMIAQDTGGAIKGWVRGDLYFGVGDEAFDLAHGQNSQGSMYILMPKVY